MAAHTALGSLLIGWKAAFTTTCCCLCPPSWWLMQATRCRLAVALLAYYLGLWALCNHLGPLEPFGRQAASRSSTDPHLHCVCVVGSAGGPLPAHHRDCRTQATQDGDAGRPGPACTNRSHFQSQARHALAVRSVPRSPWSLLLCDIDHFKQTTRGYAGRDQVLQAMAKIMTQNLRR